MYLIEPTIEHKEAYLDYIKEWEETKEMIVPFASRRHKEEKSVSYEERLEDWRQCKNRKGKVNGRVPSTLYFLMNESKILGAIHFRHELNEYLLIEGGHIGYGIRPSARGNGYADLMLKKMLEIMRSKGYEQAMLTCDDDNIPSKRTIEKNGGILKDVIPVDDKYVRRYYITLI